mmetsp:Transcript_1637/g.2211  ORF Transcript_1637/g.2211 Transcript_1637/m.2211 type:complete len:285 (+) Transcript_1637:456-1310(+)
MVNTDLVMDKVLMEYDPDIVVLCVGADGLRGDALVQETNEGWNLSPEALAECVRRVAGICGGRNPKMGVGIDTGINTSTCNDTSLRRRKLIVLGGGGYTPENTARTFALCTAAACDGVRPGMLWHEMPRDIPRHEFFERYGPSFEMLKRVESKSSDGEYSFYNPLPHDDGVSSISCTGTGIGSDDYSKLIRQGKEVITLTYMFLSKRRRELERSAHAAQEMFAFNENETMLWLPHAHNKAASSVASFTGANIQEEACNIGKPKANVDVKVKMGRRRKRKPKYHS